MAPQTYTVICGCGFRETWPTWEDADLRGVDHLTARDRLGDRAHAIDIEEEGEAMTTRTDCDICDQDRDDITQGVCEDCWLASAQPGGVHADLPLTLVGADGGEDLTLGAFAADNEGVLAAADILALLALPVGGSLTFGGGAQPIFWLARREHGE